LNFWSVPPSSTSAFIATESIPLHERIEQFVHRDGLIAFVSFAEVIPLEQARDRCKRAAKPDHAFGAELVRPRRMNRT